MPIVDIFKSAAPFIVCNVIVLLLVMLIPQISMWLPGLADTLTG
jgi:TRAP-type C4-dicarboxylate transport system permease large subunit